MVRIILILFLIINQSWIFNMKLLKVSQEWWHSFSLISVRKTERHGWCNSHFCDQKLFLERQSRASSTASMVSFSIFLLLLILYEFYQMFAYKAQYFELENFVEWSVYIAGIAAMSLRVSFLLQSKIIFFNLEHLSNWWNRWKQFANKNLFYSPKKFNCNTHCVFNFITNYV